MLQEDGVLVMDVRNTEKLFQYLVGEKVLVRGLARVSRALSVCVCVCM